MPTEYALQAEGSTAQWVAVARSVVRDEQTGSTSGNPVLCVDLEANDDLAMMLVDRDGKDEEMWCSVSPEAVVVDGDLEGHYVKENYNKGCCPLVLWSGDEGQGESGGGVPLVLSEDECGALNSPFVDHRDVGVQPLVVVSLSNHLDGVHDRGEGEEILLLKEVSE